MSNNERFTSVFNLMVITHKQEFKLRADKKWMTKIFNQLSHLDKN